MESEPPPLPRRLADPRPIVIAGTAAFAVVGLVLLIIDGTGTGVWTCLAGVLLGGIGLFVAHRQREAARRGVRGAQRGLS